MLLVQPLVLTLEELTLDSPHQISSKIFQICCPQRSEDTEILFIYRLELKSQSCPWQISQRLQSERDSILAGQVYQLCMLEKISELSMHAGSWCALRLCQHSYAVLLYTCMYACKDRFSFIPAMLLCEKRIFLFTLSSLRKSPLLQIQRAA